jgi:tetratricopeptide (TPR) repeat protein
MKLKCLTILIIILAFISCKRGLGYLFETAESKDTKVVKYEFDSDFNLFIVDDFFESEEANDLNEKGIEYIKVKNYELAEKYFLDALAVEENNPIILNNLGLINKLKVKYSEAEDYFKKSFIYSDSTYLISQNNLSLLYNDDGKYYESIDVLKYIQSVSSEEIILAISSFHLAYSYKNIYQCEKSLKEYKKAYLYFKKYEDFKPRLDKLYSEIQHCFDEIK